MPFFVNTAATDGWTSGRGYIKTPDGWKLVTHLHRKSGASTWTLEETTDVTSPPAPTLLGMTTNSANRTITVNVQMPNAPDLHHGTLKYSSTQLPPTEAGDAYIYPDDTWPARRAATPGQTLSWTIKPDYYDKVYYISVWAVDNVGNASARLRLNTTIKSPTTAPPASAPKPVKLTINAANSGSMERTTGNWSTWAGDLVVQAGVPNFAGAWFYWTRIKNALTGKTKINKFTIRIQRVNSAHGVSGAGNIYLAPMRLMTQEGRLSVPVDPVLVGTLTRGQVKTFNVPTAWWPHFLSGSFVGFALFTPSSSGTPYTHANYVQAYGRGTTSGQVYLEAQ